MLDGMDKRQNKRLLATERGEPQRRRAERRANNRAADSPAAYPEVLARLQQRRFTPAYKARVDFWSDRRLGTVRHKRIVKYEDQGETSYLVAENEWVDKDGKVLLSETRKVSVVLLDGKERMLIIDSTFTAAGKPVTLGKTPFGLLGARMAKTLGVNEKEILWKQARWVDYSGPIENGRTEGITLFDHPGNPNHPSCFHVQNDGWMGASLTYDGPREIAAEKPLRVRYGLYVHSDLKAPAEIEKQ
ncbi:MAG TPA: PmoA family protein [Sedimentisphaerales bacterium]|nr:PmoA family protein [Sedimentisphaerales bacterium]